MTEQLDAAPSSTEPTQEVAALGEASSTVTDSTTPETVSTQSDTSDTDTTAAIADAGSSSSTATGSSTGTEEETDPNVGASPVADQSESDTASSAPPASSGADIAGGQLTGTGSDAGNSPGVSDGSGIESRIMALLHVARAAMVTLEQDVSRNVHAALDGIEQLVRKG
jgi:hypothetical protein